MYEKDMFVLSFSVVDVIFGLKYLGHELVFEIDVSE